MICILAVFSWGKRNRKKKKKRLQEDIVGILIMGSGIVENLILFYQGKLCCIMTLLFN